ncbi:ABC transporter ATP-binding protein [Labrys sp. KNU-23]|uniref:ABC transporter ATP-binding protein n=1 Tax=Labrys sp. KNU-23 TaxID=2789216 RepID=UPI0011EFC79F|nr:ABC transporter ATP-binding protein [Labrys sp. KNU-23]QEN89065.1 ABC transporter ATP-binding protein [Labrys sp. KNU-23]
MALLEISNLAVEFQVKHGFFRAVDSVSLSIDPGEIVSIVGESGSGKSVAMLALMGLLPKTARITADKLAFNGLDLQKISPRERRKIIGRDMAMIFQEPMTSLNPCFTVGFQLAEAIRAHLPISRREARERSVELLKAVGITDPARRLSAFPHQMSGGMSQRVMIAMAISCNPKLLIADEPTTALDVTIQAQILDLLVKLRDERGMAVVLITHDMGVVAETAERVIVQYAGQQVERAKTGALFHTPRHPYTSALLAALPERATSQILPSIPGVVPGQYDRPRGCLFSPRCSYVTDECRAAPPKRAGVEYNEALCIHPLTGGKTARMEAVS